MRLGLLCPPVPGHLNPMRALARTLRARGHETIFFQIHDAAERIKADGLPVEVIGQSRFPPGYVRDFISELGRRPGVRGTMYWHEERASAADVLCSEVPKRAQALDLDGLLVDQIEPAGRAIAEHIGLPFATIGNGLILNREADVPPIFVGWSVAKGPIGRLKNRILTEFGDRTVDKTNNRLRDWRRRWKLDELPLNEIFFANSELLQIMQIPKALDFPRRALPSQLHYVGPLREGPPTHDVPFPWDELDGRPIVYASLGTLQVDRSDLFHMIAEGLAGLSVQAVIAHGGILTKEQEGHLPGSPIVRPWVPQEALLQRASLCVTHGGLNTVLDALSHGVPLAVMPIAFEQPAIAARITYRRVGLSTPAQASKASQLARTVEKILSSPDFGTEAAAISKDIAESGGASRAAELIESAWTGASVLTSDEVQKPEDSGVGGRAM